MLRPDDLGEFAAVLAAGGTAGALIASIGPGASPLGPPGAWSRSLRTAVAMCLMSRSPLCIFWGQELALVYNDACIPLLGGKHPDAMGRPGSECLSEFWPVVADMLAGALHRGEASWSHDLLLMTERHGYLEETYFTVSFSPIRDDGGGIGGALCVLSETTGRVVGERRLMTLSRLGEATAWQKSADEACAVAAQTMARNPADLPFVLLYLLSDDERSARLAGSSRIPPGTEASPEIIDLASCAAWPLARAAASGQPELVEGLPEPAAHMDAPLDDQGLLPFVGRPRAALVLPIVRAGQVRPAGLMVAGVSPWHTLDTEYTAFFKLVAGQVATAVAGALAYAEERQQAEALAELDRAKTVFFNDVSHEFRTPLTLLLGPLDDALADPDGLSPRQLEHVRMARRSALRLLKLVNALLDFSRLETGRVHAQFEPLDLASTTTDLASGFRAAVERAGLRLVVDCPPVPERAFVDREMWERIVLNLISNAFKFTRAGEIRVALRSSASHCALTVSDTGAGIPRDQLPRIFERFHRVPHADARTQEGTGIGLALVHDLVRLHGGTIDVVSEEGAGTTFTVRVPLGSAHLPQGPGQAPAAETPVALRAAPFVEEALRWLPDTERTHGIAAGARLLVADDNADMRAYLCHLLEQHWTVETCPDGKAALAAATERPPDLVLTDVMMPGLDGVQLLRALRADPRTAHVPVVMLSARAAQDSVIDGLDAGADDYVPKPFAARELVARVRANLELGSLRNQVARARADAELAGARRDFMNMAAHELRGPLTVVLGYLSLVQDGSIEAGSDDYAATVDTLVDKAREATGLVDHLLVAARLDTNRLALARELVDLRDLVGQAVGRARALAKLVGEALDMQVPDQPVMLSADPGHVSRILDNLIRNALTHGAGGGVTVSIPPGTEPAVCVRDAGRGIADDDREQIFEPFARMSDHITTRAGTGLGLSISRRLAEAHGGTLTLAEPAGPGATFVVRLPPPEPV